MQLSVIILNYNVRYFLELCVRSVQRALQGLDAEIIVVDNHSTDDSCTMMKTLFPEIKLIENKENLGFPKGNNIGVDQAKGEYICILNPDTVVAEDTFKKILSDVTSSAVERSNSKLGIVGCQLIDGSGRFLPESKRSVPTPWVAFTKIFGLYKVFPKVSLFNQYYAMHLNPKQSGEVDILVGAFMVMRRSLYQELGGFDENCFMYADDIDLSYRAQLAGYKNYYYHNTTVIHFKGESGVRDAVYMKRFQEAMTYFYEKHFQKSSFFTLFMRIGAFVFAGLKRFRQKKGYSKTEQYILVSQKDYDFPFPQPLGFYSSLTSVIIDDHKSTEILFDITSLSFSEMIHYMETHLSKNVTFKFWVPESQFLIGSNHANDIGQVIK